MDGHWAPFDNGASVGTRGSENGAIVRDEEHNQGARITLERDGGTAPFSITCGIYGWMFHTRFFSKLNEAEADFDHMKRDLGEILSTMPRSDDPTGDSKLGDVSRAIAEFVERFP